MLLSFKADQVIDEVNSCVKNETKGLIKNFLRLGSLYGNTALLFAMHYTAKGNGIKNSIKHIVQVPFMTTKRGSRHLYGLFGGYKILSIPYQGSNFSIWLAKTSQEAQVSNPGFMNQEFGLRKEDVSKLWIPRFKGVVLFIGAVLNPLLVA
ncbi:hypothetical protein HYC85_015204 [Camellia sinensis]|uniref:Uncharacterized protein n=1 Tax=Camellia sinensis TaxID=4442 RepID=A0A7J7GZS4_CAMSI|nr:hypothetical protein HYC85_015204 [Camellia sinensis]